MESLNLPELLPLVVPLLLVQIVLVVVSLVDLFRRRSTKGPKWVWLLVILFFSILGPVIYLLFGRGEE
ncbi:MAG: transcriptional regulator [Anaerolineales bacterium]|nr:transcriptional regulator [Anaerolineales bacterium]